MLIRIHKMTLCRTSTTFVALVVKYRIWPTRKRLYCSVVKAMGSWLLRLIAISWREFYLEGWFTSTKRVRQVGQGIYRNLCLLYLRQLMQNASYMNLMMNCTKWKMWPMQPRDTKIRIPIQLITSFSRSHWSTMTNKLTDTSQGGHKTRIRKPNSKKASEYLTSIHNCKKMYRQGFTVWEQVPWPSSFDLDGAALNWTTNDRLFHEKIITVETLKEKLVEPPTLAISSLQGVYKHTPAPVTSRSDASFSRNSLTISTDQLNISPALLKTSRAHMVPQIEVFKCGVESPVALAQLRRM